MAAGAELGALTARSIGLRSVFTKTLRDSRAAVLLAGVFIVVVMISAGAAMATAFGTPEARQQAARIAEAMPPILQGMLGPPVGLDSLGGFIEWRFQSILLLLLPIWSIVALSSTLALEADRGSLDLVLLTGASRRRVALEKLAGHLLAVGLAMVVLLVTLLLVGLAFGTLPGDEITLRAAGGYTALTTVMILLPGAIAFAAAPCVGRNPAAGLAAALMIAAYFVVSFRTAVPGFDALAPASWYSWTRDHIPLAGLEDWASLLGPVALIAVLAVVGVVAFERRDVGSVARIPSPRLPTAVVGLGGPLARSLGEQLPTALAWGIGMATYVAVLATAIPALAGLLRDVPLLAQMLRLVYPDIDITSVGGMLQLIFVEFGMVLVGLATATIVAGWASDETSGRLETILAAPLGRRRWVVTTGLGAYLAILVLVGIVALGTGIGAALEGSPVLTPVIGTFVLAFYGWALAGVGLAVGGVVRASLAGPVVVVLTVATFLDTILAPPLELPDWVLGLALSTHFGKPLVGEWDSVGVIAALALALGGLGIAAIGFGRRDVGG